MGTIALAVTDDGLVMMRFDSLLSSATDGGDGSCP